MNYKKEFLKDTDKKAFDHKHRQTINFNMEKYHNSVDKGVGQYIDHELARSRAAYLKTQTIEHLDKYLLEFEANFTKNGGKIIWAENGAEALQAIGEIFDEKNASSLVKSKSMTTEEIALNEYLESGGVEVVETDLGEYIVQLAGQKPYHIVTPAMHLSKKDISEIFTDKLGIEPTDDARELTLTARRMLRKKYLQADIGITGANFLVADIGGIAITENEGNGRLSMTFPKTHIAIVGIEKVIPKLEYLDLFWSMLSTSGTGQKLTVYNSIVSAPKKEGEFDGPEEMYVILLDNGRSKLLADTDKRQSLNCIRCGACLNACPVYKNIGGHSYNTTYSGPIGAVISPQLKNLKDFNHLSFASSLCGACSAVCPVRIDIHNLLLKNREQSIEENQTSFSDKVSFNFWKKAMLKRSRLNRFSGKFKNKMLQKFFKKAWGKRRVIPKVAPKSFNELWQERQNLE